MDAAIFLEISADSSELQSEMSQSARSVEDFEGKTRKLSDAGSDVQRDMEESASAMDEFEGSARKAAESSGGLGDALTKVGEMARGVQAIKGAFDMAAGAVGDFFGEALEAERGTAQLEARLASTNSAAGMTKTQLLDLAGSLSASGGLSRATDDAVLSAISMGLTFTNVGSTVFPAMEQAVLDVATVMNQGAAPSAEQLSAQSVALGKALNDPTAGLSALTRIGVTFTDGQKEQIRTMQAAGDMAGAQTVILQELGREFGGAAAASAQTFEGKLDSLGAKFDDVKQAAGERLLPMVEDVVDMFASPATMDAVESFADMIVGGIETVVDAAEMLGPVIQPAMQFLQDNSEATGAAVAAMFGAMAIAATAAALPIVATMLPVIAVMGVVAAAAFALKMAWDNNFMHMQEGPQTAVGMALVAFEQFKKGLLMVSGFIEPWIDTIGQAWQSFSAMIKGETVKAGDEFKSNLTAKIEEGSRQVEQQLVNLHSSASSLMHDAGADAAREFALEVGSHAAGERQDALDQTRQDMQKLATDAAELGADTGFNWMSNLAAQFDKNKAALQARINNIKSAMGELGTMDSSSSDSQVERRERQLQKELDAAKKVNIQYEGKVGKATVSYTDTSGYDKYADKASASYGKDPAVAQAQKKAASDAKAAAKEVATAEKEAATAAKEAQDALNATSLAPFEESVYRAQTAVNMAKDALEEATAAIQPFGDAADAAQEQVDLLQHEIALAERGLLPFKQAVSDAGNELASAKEQLAAAQDGLSPYEDAVAGAQDRVHGLENQLRLAQQQLLPFKDDVKAAQTGLDEATASLEAADAKLQPFRDEIGKNEAAIAALEIQLRHAKEELRPFEDAVASAEQAVTSAQRALDDAALRLAPLEQAAQQAAYGVADLEIEVRNAEYALAPFEAAVAESGDALDAANEQLKTAQGELQNYQSEIAAAQDALTSFGQTPLAGSQAFSDAAFENEQAIARLQYALNELNMQPAGKPGGELEEQKKALQEQIDLLRLKGQQLKLQEQIELDPQRRELDKLANGTPAEMSFDQAVGAIQAQKDLLDKLYASQSLAQQAVSQFQHAQEGAQQQMDLSNAALKEQEKSVNELRDALEQQKRVAQEADDALAHMQRSLDPYKNALADAKHSLEDANRALDAQQQKLDPINRALDIQKGLLADNQDAYAEAQKTLEPYMAVVGAAQGKLDSANKALQDQVDALDPLNRALDTQKGLLADAQFGLSEAQKVLVPYKQAVDDAQKALDGANASLKTQQDNLAPLYTALDNQNQVLDDANWAYSEAQKTLDPYNAALATAQGHLDDANKALADHRDALDPVKSQYMEINDELSKWETHLANLGKAGVIGPATASTAATTAATAPLVTAGGSGAFAPVITVFVNGVEIDPDSVQVTLGTDTRLRNPI